jgi:hypothetical protein
MINGNKRKKKPNYSYEELKEQVLKRHCSEHKRTTLLPENDQVHLKQNYHSLQKAKNGKKYDEKQNDSSSESLFQSQIESSGEQWSEASQSDSVELSITQSGTEEFYLSLESRNSQFSSSQLSHFPDSVSTFDNSQQIQPNASKLDENNSFIHVSDHSSQPQRSDRISKFPRIHDHNTPPKSPVKQTVTLSLPFNLLFGFFSIHSF